MESYEPFLLPLLKAAFPDISDPPQPPASPLDEETLCASLSPVTRPWPALARESSRIHGLPLLTDFPENPDRLRDVLSSSGPPRRLIRIHNSTTKLLLLEHPSALAGADHFLLPDESPALARPSVFLQCRERLQRPGNASPKVGESTPCQSFRVPETASITSFLLEFLHRFPAASDWHLEPHEDHYASRLRVLTHLQPLPDLPRQRGDWLLRGCLAAAGCDHLPPGTTADGSFSLPAIQPEQPALQIRLAAIPALHGHALALRFLHPREIPGLASLGLPQTLARDLLQCLQQQEGLGLVAGPTGSGKSTTLHALLHSVVRAGHKVLSAEDPVETSLPGVQQVSVDPERGLSFAKALRAFLRQAPDCLMVGEIRDTETAAIAIQAARSGHRVLSSVHARSTNGVFRRFADLLQPAEDLLAVTSFLLHQRMATRRCPHCVQNEPVPPAIRQGALAAQIPLPESVPHAAGCPRCHQGHAGRQPVFVMARLQPPDSTAHEFARATLHAVLHGTLHPDALHRQFGRDSGLPSLNAPSR